MATIRAPTRDDVRPTRDDANGAGISSCGKEILIKESTESLLMKVAAACGDMRKALCVCRSAIEIAEGELRDSNTMNLLEPDNTSTVALLKSDCNIVRAFDKELQYFFLG
ncbi:hypothetical protein ACHQM5_014295 [Ranunculus cassubicifolius]